MTRSMTGYGRARAEIDQVDIAVEIRSVNHRYLDVTVKAPKIFGYLDEAIKTLAGKEIARGKVDVYVSVDMSQAGGAKISLNRPVLESYLSVLAELKNGYGLAGEPTVIDAARFPDVLSTVKEEEDAEKMSARVLAVFSDALSGYQAMREREGEKLADDILSRMDLLESQTQKIELRSPQTVAEYKEKLLLRMREALEGATVDPQRILTEAAIFADKVAVNEETVRLKSHFNQLRNMLKGHAPSGRKMDFIVQEINREINTIGSKCSDYEMTALVIDMKAEVEKIREQIQNIE